jgi:hypothetical protein
MKRIERAWLGSVLAATVVAVAATSAGAQSRSPARNPFLGVWVLNAEKSQFTPTIYVKSTIRIEVLPGKVDQQKTTVDTILENGTPLHYEYAAAYDGKDYPLYFPTADAVSVKQIDARSIELSYKKAGKVNTVFIYTLALDGKTMTVSQKGTNYQGLRVDNLMVFERKS